MFAKDEDMQVTQEPDGTIRMVEKAVPQDLLNVKIGHISFDDWQKKGHGMFSPPLVLSVIVGAPEVEAFMKDHNIGQKPKMINGPVNPKTLVSGELTNVTLSQALDHTLKTFPRAVGLQGVSRQQGEQSDSGLFFLSILGMTSVNFGQGGPVCV